VKEYRVKFHESTRREAETQSNPIEPFLFQFGGVADLLLQLMGCRILLCRSRRLPFAIENPSKLSASRFREQRQILSSVSFFFDNGCCMEHLQGFDGLV
jgi:hypothetical protein